MKVFVRWDHDRLSGQSIFISLWCRWNRPLSVLPLSFLKARTEALRATVLYSLYFHAASPWMLIQTHTDGFFGCWFWWTRVPVTYIDIVTSKPFSSCKKKKRKKTIKKGQNVCLYCNRCSLIHHIIIRHLRCHFDIEKKSFSLKLTQKVNGIELSFKSMLAILWHCFEMMIHLIDPGYNSLAC